MNAIESRSSQIQDKLDMAERVIEELKSEVSVLENQVNKSKARINKPKHAVDLLKDR